MLDQKASTEPPDRGVLCAKCEHLNQRGNSECKRCGSHLYVTCVDCGKRNERVRTRCLSCGRQLHRSLMQKLRKKLIGGRVSITPLQVFAFFIAIGLVFGLIVLVASIRLPSLW